MYDNSNKFTNVIKEVSQGKEFKTLKIFHKTVYQLFYDKYSQYKNRKKYYKMGNLVIWESDNLLFYLLANNESKSIKTI